MATFLIKRLRPSLQEKYRWTPISSSPHPLKPNDFLDDADVDGESVYHAWTELKEANRELRVGDLLVAEDGKIFQCTYSGFEEATWLAMADGDPVKADENQPGPEQLASYRSDPGGS